MKNILSRKFFVNISMIKLFTLIQATGIGGVGGYFWYTPPLAENFSKIPPLEILGQAAILFFKWEKNVKIYLNLTRFRSN